MTSEITFTRLTQIPVNELVEHMSNPIVAEHMPLLTGAWSTEQAEQFVAAKEACWEQDGLGHWGILKEGSYVGWGGFQKEEGEWDFGLVLKPECFGLGPKITQLALDFARQDARIPYVTFLLPPSRSRLRGLERLGATFEKEISYDGETFLKYRLDTV